MTITPVMWRAARVEQVLDQVERRLVSRGGVVELDHLHKLSDDEIAVLVRQERGLG